MVDRLRFFADRFEAHKKAIEFTKEKFDKITTELKQEKYLDFMPNGMDFYVKALHFVVMCRNFVCFTYPLAYMISSK
jgi:hypothetical protein